MQTTGREKTGNQATAEQYFRRWRWNLLQHDPCGCKCLQVQNVSQSLEVVDLRTARDLQYVRDSEPLLRGVDGRLHTYVANPRTLTAKSLQVHTQAHAHKVKDGCLRVNITFGVKTSILRMPSWSFLSDSQLSVMKGTEFVSCPHG